MMRGSKRRRSKKRGTTEDLTAHHLTTRTPRATSIGERQRHAVQALSWPSRWPSEGAPTAMIPAGQVSGMVLILKRMAAADAMPNDQHELALREEI